ncbi:MAG: ZIP family metal transporter [Halieaceae bacterium]
MNTVTLLFTVYLAAIFAASLLGGWLPRRFQLTHTRTQLIMSLVAGLMLGVAFFHLIPHSTLTPPVDVDFTMRWAVMGLVFMLVLLRLFHFHQHDFTLAEADCEHGHADAHPHNHAHEHGHTSSPNGAFTWLGLLLGLSVHTVVDGIALGAVMRAEPTGGGVLGLGVFLAILLHKPLDSLSIETVMAAAGKSSASRRWINVGFSALCPLAAAVFWLVVDPAAADSLLLSGALAFSAGAFICIALGDLLPEIQFHSHDRGKLTGLFLLGLGLAWGIGLVEGIH